MLTKLRGQKESQEQFSFNIRVLCERAEEIPSV